MAEQRDPRHWRDRHRVRKEGSRRQSVVLVLLAFLIVSLLVAGIGLWVLGQKAYVRIDPNTLCPTDRPPSEVTVLLLDMSDELTEAQRLQLQNALNNLKARIARFGLIEIYKVEPSAGRVITPVTRFCNPGDGQDVNQLYQNPGLITARWKKFSDDLNSQVTALMSSAGSPVSPVMEAIQAAALRTLGLPEHQNIARRLVVASDLMQNVPEGFSQYNSATKFAEFQQTPYFNRVRGDLTGVTVTCLYLVRPRSPQQWPDHRVFWERYFEAQGATVDRIEPIFGAQ